VNVTVDPNTTVSAITNTATVDWANFDNSSQTGSAESAVTITVPQPLALTGGTLPIVALILGILAVLAGAGAVILGRRRRGEKAAQL
jgi:LPXTG-motif cell wall-anchored protein